MATFTVVLDASLPAAEVWRRVWNLDVHSRVIPFTTLRGDGTGGTRLTEGGRFVARTAVGPFAFDDVMTATHFDPPDSREGIDPLRAHIEKSGRVVMGHIDAQVATTPRGSRLLWRQDIALAGVPRLLQPVTAAVATVAYRSILRRLIATP